MLVWVGANGVAASNTVEEDEDLGAMTVSLKLDKEVSKMGPAWELRLGKAVSSVLEAPIGHLC